MRVQNFVGNVNGPDDSIARSIGRDTRAAAGGTINGRVRDNGRANDAVAHAKGLEHVTRANVINGVVIISRRAPAFENVARHLLHDEIYRGIKSGQIVAIDQVNGALLGGSDQQMRM